MDNQPDSAALPQRLGDPVGWVDIYGDYLFRYALARVGGEHAAEDLVQETFLSALQSRANFQGRSSERTWLTGIMKNKILEYYRKNRRSNDDTLEGAYGTLHREIMDKHNHWEMDPEKAPAACSPSPSERLENSEFWGVMAECLKKLPVNASRVFTLREIDGVETADICAAIGVSESNLWVLLHRSRFILRRCLELNWFSGGSRSGGGGDAP